MLANLRAFPPRGTINEVWNHGVYKYIATYQAIPGRGPRAVKLSVELHANSGSMLNGQDDKDRVVNYEYNLVYGLDGRVDETNPVAADWISVGGDALYAPLNVLELVESRWGGHNQQVTEANVRSIDLANGGGQHNRRLAGRSAAVSSESRSTRPAAARLCCRQRRISRPAGSVGSFATSSVADRVQQTLWSFAGLTTAFAGPAAASSGPTRSLAQTRRLRAGPSFVVLAGIPIVAIRPPICARSSALPGAGCRES